MAGLTEPIAAEPGIVVGVDVVVTADAGICKLLRELMAGVSSRRADKVGCGSCVSCAGVQSADVRMQNSSALRCL